MNKFEILLIVQQCTMYLMGEENDSVTFDWVEDMLENQDLTGQIGYIERAAEYFKLDPQDSTRHIAEYLGCFAYVYDGI